MSNTDDLKGRVKESAGDLTGDKELKNEGRVDEASGTIKDKVGGAADKVKDAVNPDRASTPLKGPGPLAGL